MSGELAGMVLYVIRTVRHVMIVDCAMFVKRDADRAAAQGPGCRGTGDRSGGGSLCWFASRPVGHTCLGT